MSGFRIEKLERLIQGEISSLIVMQRIKDPRVSSFLTVNRVVLSRDLSQAKVYVSSFQSDGKIQRGLDGLRSAAGFIQSHIGSRIRTKSTPKLVFYKDDSVRTGQEMIKKLDELQHEDKGS